MDATPQVLVLERLMGFLQQDPDNWNLRADVFDAAVAAGQLETARAEAERALAARPDDAAWQHRLATLMLASKRYPEAQSSLERLIAQGHRDPAILHNLAFALFRQGRSEAASAVLEPLLGSPEPDAAVAWVLWLRCQHWLGRVAAALDALRKRLSVAPVPVEALGVASIMAADVEQLGEAAQWADAALSTRPDQLEALATKGTLALAEQDASGALAWFERALEQNPTDGRCWSGVALARMLGGDLARADDAFARAVTTMPDHIGTWIGWGWCLVAQKRLPGAHAKFEQALALDRNFGESHGCIAVTLARSGRKEEAEREIALALRLDPRGMAARFAQAVLSGQAEDPRALQALARLALRRGQPAGS
jgi:tetratricopeptide (TPR) repeat protein